MTCLNCIKHCWMPNDDGCASFCMEKGTEVPDNFSKRTHFCCIPEEDIKYPDYFYNLD